MNVSEIATALRLHPSINSKRSISKATYMLDLGQTSVGRPGDDAAILQRDDGGFDLLAGEGFIPAFIKDDPWFAGWCGVMVNVSDIAAMGGRAMGVIDQIWAPDAATAEPLMCGLRDAATVYGVPVLGGHTNFSTDELNLAVSIFGRANALITSFDANPGDVLIAAIDMRGNYRSFDNFFAAGDASQSRLRRDLEILPGLAEDGLAKAGKDISQGGIAGTALMLAECSGVGIKINLELLNPPSGASHERWLRSFPSFGYLLCVPPQNVDRVCDRFKGRDIEASPIGMVTEGVVVEFQTKENSCEFWNYSSNPYLGLGKREPYYA